MTPVTDLHPDDLAARLSLRALLVERRHERGLSQARLAKAMGLSQTAIAHVEKGTNWHLLVLQRYAHAVNLRIVAYPDALPGVGTIHDPTADVFRPSDPERAHRWDQANLIGNLGAARRAVGLTQAVVAERLDLTERAVSNYEHTKTGVVLISPQRYCRALGGALAIEVEDLAALEVAA
ncbi:helix-turn-helix transcriptional regulator [Micromonospora sp. NPDC049089]|uniref:helix-turn-helix transcriptional regulator n=1 Tax=Micromonospora sp. NPDC049089 TaxID=3155496 RepID=UPI0033DFBBA8